MQFGGTKVVKDLHYGNSKLIDGINHLADFVGSTLGAGGRTVIIEDDFGNPHITKDGVTVAESILLHDPVENLGVSIVKQAAKQTASKAGDGTTTSTVLAQSLIESYIALNGREMSTRDIKSGFDKYLEKVNKELDKRSVKVDDKRLQYVSTISANNDKALGGLIADAFKSAGEHGIVTMETSPTSETYVQVVDGTKIDSTTKSPHFYTNNEKELAELENPLVFISASEIPNVRKIQDILEYAIKSNRSILLIAPLESQPLAALAMNKVKGNIKVNVIDPPSFGMKRKDILEDIAFLVGGKVFDESLGDSLDAISPDLLGTAEKAISDNEGTVLVVSEATEGVSERVSELKKALADTDHHVLTKHLEKRLSLLTGGVSQIFVGADTEVELKEKKDRVDDAVQAVKAAKKEGILPGGGVALAWCANMDWEMKLNQGEFRGVEIIRDAMIAPFFKILDNAGLDPTHFTLEKFGEGVDVTDGKVKDMRKAGIIDPTMVTKQALTNAVSVAKTVLETDYIISNKREE